MYIDLEQIAEEIEEEYFNRIQYPIDFINTIPNIELNIGEYKHLHVTI